MLATLVTRVDWGGLAVLLALGLVLAWSGTVLLTAWRLVRPRRRGYGSRVARGLAGDPSELMPPASCDAWTTTIDGCPVWELRGDDESGPAVVFLHGWGRSRHDVLERFAHVRSVVSRMVALDLPGHGGSRAGYSGLGATEHRVVLEVVASVGGPLPAGRPVVVWGWSLGAGVALRAASEADVAGVIFEAGYAHAITPARAVLRAAGLPHRTTLPAALGLIGLIRGDSWRGFDRVGLAAGCRTPMLVLHDATDEVCPIGDARAIARASPAATLIDTSGIPHRDAWTEQNARGFAPPIVEFLTGCGA